MNLACKTVINAFSTVDCLHDIPFVMGMATSEFHQVNVDPTRRLEPEEHLWINNADAISALRTLVRAVCIAYLF